MRGHYAGGCRAAYNRTAWRIRCYACNYAGFAAVEIPDRTPILALVVAVAALFWSGANTFFTFFWHPEDFRVYIRHPNAKPLQDTADTVDINYFFSNMGNQAALIEGVTMSELWINSVTSLLSQTK